MLFTAMCPRRFALAVLAILVARLGACAHAYGLFPRPGPAPYLPPPVSAWRDIDTDYGSDADAAIGAQHARPPVPLPHDASATSYKNWRYASADPTSGFVWGLQCKGPGCEMRTPFILTPGGLSSSPSSPSTSSPSALEQRLAVETEWTDESSVLPGALYCPRHTLVSAMACSDYRCSAVKLLCAPLQRRFVLLGPFHVPGDWAGPERTRMYCPQGMYMSGVTCGPSCADKRFFSVLCTKVGFRHHYGEY